MKQEGRFLMGAEDLPGSFQLEGWVSLGPAPICLGICLPPASIAMKSVEKKL